jgi:hypothetical protein
MEILQIWKKCPSDGNETHRYDICIIQNQTVETRRIFLEEDEKIMKKTRERTWVGVPRLPFLPELRKKEMLIPCRSGMPWG